MNRIEDNEPPCECQGPGFCPRYGIHQSEYHHGVCTGKGSPGHPCTAEKSAKYRAKWRRMVGRKQIEPVTEPIHQSRRVVVLPQSPSGRRNTPPNRPVGINPPLPTDGTKPGTELKKLLESLHLFPQEGTCKCNERVSVMDRWGANECERRREEIITWLRTEAAKRGWLEKLNAARFAISLGIFVNPVDPYPGLLDEAIKRARNHLNNPDPHPNIPTSTGDSPPT